MFYMLSYHERLNGLIHTLSAKFAQDDVHFVKDLQIPTDDPGYVEALIDERGSVVQKRVFLYSIIKGANFRINSLILLSHVRVRPS